MNALCPLVALNKDVQLNTCVLVKYIYTKHEALKSGSPDPNIYYFGQLTSIWLRFLI